MMWGYGTMGKMQLVLNEMHLYHNKVESLVKSAFWVISWVGTILSHKNDGFKILNGSYFILSLSLLMEFVPQIKEKKYFLSRMIHTIFCVILILVFIVSCGSLMGLEVSKCWPNTIYILTMAAIIFVCIDVVVLWITKDVVAVSDDNSTKSLETEEYIRMYQESLKNGKLGSIGMEENKDD